MTKNDTSKVRGGDWFRSQLSLEEQECFWDRQAATYDTAEMTRDNDSEIHIVRSLCREFVNAGFTAKDVVTLGGANGCRDPLCVTDELSIYRQAPDQIFFNDLSEEMTRVASQQALAAYKKQGVDLTVLPGQAHAVIDKIPARPRRVILGVYSAHAFLNASAVDDFPYCGLEEYARNGHILGDLFCITPQAFAEGEYQVLGEDVFLEAYALAHEITRMRRRLSESISRGRVAAFKVIGRHRDDTGSFLSHWFSGQGITRLLQASFPLRKNRLSITPCAKGFVVCIDPSEPPQGIVTMLNNVLGNILPHEHVKTLRAISSIAS